MKRRPCGGCERLPPPGEPYTPTFCRECFLYHTDPAYHLLWGGPGITFAPPPLPCVHFGPATGARADCPTCPDRVSLKLFACAVHGECTPSNQTAGVACCRDCPDYTPDTFSLVAPAGTADALLRWEGRGPRKPWDYPCTAVVPHLDTVEPLRVVVDLLRLQTRPPYVLVIDTGSPPAVCAELERLRHHDLEVHFVRGHGYCHSSAPVAVAQDLAMALCRTEHLYCTHADVFLKRRDYLEWLLARCSAANPAVGYEMSPRPWAGDQWRGMVSHTATMLHMPTMRRLGVTWNMEHAYRLAGWEGKDANGWPDTETGMNLVLRNAGVRPELIGPERNYELHDDANLVHVRSYPGTKIYGNEADYHRRAAGWMRTALAQARARTRAWEAAGGGAWRKG